MAIIVDTGGKDHVFCVDCKHSQGSNRFMTWWKRLTKSDTLMCSYDSEVKARTNLITGKIFKTKPRLRLCEQNRSADYRCGEEGKHWSPYDKHKLFIYLKRI